MLATLTTHGRPMTLFAGSRDIEFMTAKDPQGSSFVCPLEPVLHVGDLVLRDISLCRVTDVVQNREHQTFRLTHVLFYVGNPR